MQKSARAHHKTHNVVYVHPQKRYGECMRTSILKSGASSSMVRRHARWNWNSCACKLWCEAFAPQTAKSQSETPPSVPLHHRTNSKVFFTVLFILQNYSFYQFINFVNFKHFKIYFGFLAGKKAPAGMSRGHTLVFKKLHIWKIWPEMGRRGSVWAENGWK